MKSIRRYLSLLVCLALSLVVFCPPVTAEAANSDDIHAYFYGGVYGFNPDNLSASKITYTTVQTGSSGVASVLTSQPYELNSENYYGQYYVTISKDDNSILVNSGDSVAFRVDNLYSTFLITGDSINRVMYQPTYMYYTLTYADGSSSGSLSLDLSITYNATKQNYMFTLNIKPTQDVRKITFYSLFYPDDDSLFSAADGYECNVGLTFGCLESYPLSVTVDEIDETTGLLSGIIDWIKDLWATCSSGFANIVAGLGDLLNSLNNLPSKIWSFIEDGLKNLFIPDEDFILSYKDRWNDLLADRLGAVWQVTYLLFESWEDITLADQQNTIDLPVVTIPLPGNNSFSFGGYSVPIVPSGFEFLASALKTISGIVCTTAFVNGIRKRYDEVMGVEQ